MVSVLAEMFVNLYYNKRFFLYQIYHPLILNNNIIIAQLKRKQTSTFQKPIELS